MQLELTICKASEVVDLVKARDKDNLPFTIVISIEGPADGPQGRAPRLATAIGAEWLDRQIILACNDVETGAGVPPPELVQGALTSFEKWRPADGVMRVLIHCRSGKSRSTALGLVLLRHHHGTGTEKECLAELLRVRPVAAPNLAIVQHGDMLLGCAGALVQVEENDPEVTRRRAEAGVGRAPHSVMVSWHLGEADKGRAQIRESISAAERSNEPASVIAPLTYACMLYRELREPANVLEVAERLLAISREQQLPGMVAFANVSRGWALAEQGRTDEGIALIRDGLDSMISEGAAPTALTALSEALARAGKLEEALATIEQTFATARKSAIELVFVLWRRGEFHLQRGDETAAESDFREALSVAQRIGSKAYQLRATTSLARLLAKQDNRNEARTMLAEIYAQFTEGLETADLKDASALFKSLT
jgi:tetratricopeptide (TPR) repeat protein